MQGGVTGKKLEPVIVDPASNWPLFAEKTKQLLDQDKVSVIFGCWTSVSRKSVLPVVAFSVGEEELRGVDTKPFVGHQAAWNYFQSIKNPDNTEFIKK